MKNDLFCDMVATLIRHERHEIRTFIAEWDRFGACCLAPADVLETSEFQTLAEREQHLVRLARSLLSPHEEVNLHETLPGLSHDDVINLISALMLLGRFRDCPRCNSSGCPEP